MYKEILLAQNKNGDSMLLQIKDKILLLKIITYLDELNIPYTTDSNNEYEYIIMAELSRKNLSLIEKTDKKVIFITYLIEDKIITRNQSFLLKINNILNKCFKIIVSMPSIKKIINKENTIVIEKPINNIDLYSHFKINKRKRKILLIDLEGKQYNKIEYITKLYPKYEYIYLTYNPKIKNNNYIVIKDFNNITYIELIRMSNLVIVMDINIDITYLYPIMLLKKQLLMKESPLYDGYLINSKNIYLFKDKKELLLKLKKIIEKRIANLTYEAYELVNKNSYEQTILKIKNIFNKM